MASNLIGRFYWAGRLEGGSFLVLLLIAMPLKYFAHEPLAVRVVGMLHGLLFLAYLAVLMQVASELEWPKGRVFKAFVAALIPFGPFIFETQLRSEAPKP
ncbi:MAG TPA: DUF3817 domain-containing protein [Polyangiaceae bacterium]|jgi:integral membrane protein|nr:DUF3817 domain-containing protein [Polyangiaceae bacterium]